MKIKTSELSGVALDWTVAKCEGLEVSVVIADGEPQVWFNHDIFLNIRSTNTAYLDKNGLPRFLCEGKPVGIFGNPMPSYLDWAQGGQIIEREHINLSNNHSPHFPMEKARWTAEKKDVGVTILTKYTYSVGETPLIAAMRCYVASKLGDEVEIPEELVGTK